MEIYRNTWQGNSSVKLVAGCGPNGVGIVSFFACNFKCPFCFAQKYSYNTSTTPIDRRGSVTVDPEALATHLVDFLQSYPDICYIQLTGGEPILNLRRAEETIEALQFLDSRLEGPVRVIYQTNGLFLGAYTELPGLFLRIADLRNVKVLFEISLKGTNEEEFLLLSGTSDGGGFERQLNAYWLLRGAFQESVSANTVARLGTGHHRRTIHFIHPETGESLFRPRTWDPQFRAVFEDTTRRFGQNRMIAECVNAEGDGGINNYVHRSIPAIARLLEEGCVTSRTPKSLAVVKACTTFGLALPAAHPDPQGLQRHYAEFLASFEPMGDPAHSYCGRDEFHPRGRLVCPTHCQYHPPAPPGLS